ncbi:MAG TPA: tRNA lysidine(34) synthetase TilS [Aeromicrobium sp.]|nr:tRNA lysidine(34) synthetase TilS [Aeromicrobium sp.]
MGLDRIEASARHGVRAVLDDLDPGSRLTIGLSGGSDSLALTVATAFVARADRFELEAVVIDHGLQDGSADVAARAADQARSLGVAAEVVKVDVARAGGPEAAARTARLEALTSRGADAVLLGHTLDDQAETVLLGLGRGSGPRSIAGMSSRAGVFRRPLLGLTRADTQHICRLHDLTWWEDPHNSDPRFRRSRLRSQVLPLLEDVLGGGVVQALARTADLVRADVDLLDSLAAATDSTSVPELAALHPALRSRVLRSAALRAGAAADELAAHHIAELDRLVTDFRGQVRVELPGGVSAHRSDGRISFFPTPGPADASVG